MFKRSFFLLLFLGLAVAGNSLQNPQPSKKGSEDTCSLSAPSSLTLNPNVSSVYASWSSVSGAVGYELKAIDTSSSVEVWSSHESGVSQTITGLQSGHTYRVKVAGICSGGEVSYDFVVTDTIMP